MFGISLYFTVTILPNSLIDRGNEKTWKEKWKKLGQPTYIIKYNFEHKERIT